MLNKITVVNVAIKKEQPELNHTRTLRFQLRKGQTPLSVGWNYLPTACKLEGWNETDCIVKVG